LLRELDLVSVDKAFVPALQPARHMLASEPQEIVLTSKSTLIRRIGIAMSVMALMALSAVALPGRSRPRRGSMSVDKSTGSI
ncbi:hypothetical protein EBZ80_01030, partial [bacterium]|nr:hypothetical protein [bacterium]